jgi:hypothetical protein
MLGYPVKIRKIVMPMDWRTVPPLAAYINRIGAEQLNFKKFIVKDYIGDYYVERTIITLGADGAISCSKAEYAPTDEERDAIKAAFLNGNFAVPTWVKASPAKLPELRALLGNNDVTYEFYERGTDTILMVQQRATRADGRKQYRPWSYWSDGLWRCMEPECQLPLWKPRYSTNKRRIMLHEGAKPAAYMHDLCTNAARGPELDEHPWRDEIIEYEHWGVIGGALAPGRTDYATIRTERPLELVYVCDNDFAGRAVLQEISRLVEYPLRGVMLDDEWPKSWDMADPLPRGMFGSTGRWTGMIILYSMTTGEPLAGEQVCQGNLYAAEFVLLQGEKEEALRLYRAAASSCPKSFIEWAAATAAIRALGKGR